MLPHIRAADWNLVPKRCRDELLAYIDYGHPPVAAGLVAVLSNDLNGAVDSLSPPELADLVLFLRRHIPSIAWGSGEKIAMWEQVGGLEGAAVH